VEKEAAHGQTGQQRKDKKDRVEKIRRRAKRQMRRDHGVETDSTNEDEDDDASAGSGFWAIPDTSLVALTSDSVSSFLGEATIDFPAVEEADFKELPALFSGSMAMMAFVSLPAEPSVGCLSRAICTGSFSASGPMATPLGALPEMFAPTSEAGAPTGTLSQGHSRVETPGSLIMTPSSNLGLS
jgi:hypothetical protein